MGGEPVGRNVHFYRAKIEVAWPDFEAWCKCIEIEAEASPVTLDNGEEYPKRVPDQSEPQRQLIGDTGRARADAEVVGIIEIQAAVGRQKTRHRSSSREGELVMRASESFGHPMAYPPKSCALLAPWGPCSTN
jgi:hypothetical protein